MRQDEKHRFDDLDAGLQDFSQSTIALLGIATVAARQSLVRQMIDSLHRIEFVKRLGERPIDPARLDPDSNLFDPIKAAFSHLHGGDVDEAAWLVFLSTHFGFHRIHRWELTRRVYGALGLAPAWTWKRTSTRLTEFREWFVLNAGALADVPFGNHRKYESVRVDAENDLADTVSSYVAWIGSNRGHKVMLADAAATFGSDPKKLFDGLYRSMNVVQFGRTGKFDYLTMLGKLGIAHLEPPYPYLSGASGPVRGAKMLLTGSPVATMSTAELTDAVVRLGQALGVGMQVMEDALCNWQKSQDKYLPFRG